MYLIKNSHNIYYFIVSGTLRQGRRQKNSKGGERGQWRDQNREKTPISFPPFISGRLEGALGMHPRLTSRERCIKSPC